MTISEQYHHLKNTYQNHFEKTQRTTNIIAGLRLLVILLWAYAIYFFYSSAQYPILICVSILLTALFLRLIIIHLKYKEQAQLYQSLIQINENEINYLQGNLSPFKKGEKYINPAHLYSYDLDIFGQGSIFQHINRTSTAIGEEQLASWLKNDTPIDILQHQKAVKELALKWEWRQYFAAIGQLHIDEDLDISKFKEWLYMPLNYQKATLLRGVSFIVPALTVATLIAYFVTLDDLYFNILKGLFGFNIFIVALQQKNIKEEHRLLNNTSSLLKKYGKLLEHIENQSFDSDILKTNLVEKKSSQSIQKLSKILNSFDNINNPFAALLLNGVLQYHLHTLFALEKWKIEHKKDIFKWFETIGMFEALSSIANFAYNNPDFIMPQLRDEPHLILKEIGHPLIARQKRICNDIRFETTKFVVLTGSNMSGKSTFLRTLGINLVLAKIGSPVCAEVFEFYPFNVCVSMRIDDSLQNSESLFFSELKRLKGIIATLDEPVKSFIILDEILRGTNSNDKRAGTQGLIHRLIAKNAVGIIATHDLIIGEMIEEYPHYLTNKCFEAQIIQNELLFDYKLRDGVCQQMSAAFLMKKMDII